MSEINALGWLEETRIWRCCKCAEPGVVYCVDCPGIFCRPCSERIHQKSDADHSLEGILEFRRHGVQFLTPLVDELVCGSLFLYLMWRVHIPPDYMTAAKYCPWLEGVRSVLSHADPGATQLLQDTLHEACGVEDAFWRFFGDAWVRTIVTGTDTPLILLSSSVSVLCSDVALIFILVPLVSASVSLIMWILHLVERQLPRSSSLLQAEALIRLVNLMDIVEDVPPVTALRPTVADNAWDFFSYRIGRFFRIPTYYYSRLSERLESISKYLLFGTLAFRVVCIMYGIYGVVLLLLAAVGLAALHGWLPELVPKRKHYQAVAYSSVTLVVLLLSTPRRYHTHWQWFCELPPKLASARMLWRAVGRPEVCHNDDMQQTSDQVFWLLSKRLVSVGRQEFTLLFGILILSILVVLAGLPAFWRHLVKRQLG